MSTTQPVILVILDGFGINPRKKATRSPTRRRPIWTRCCAIIRTRACRCRASDVGLPAGQMGNSEVGHMILGAGTDRLSGLTLIHKDIDEGGFYKNPVLLEALRKTKSKQRSAPFDGASRRRRRAQPSASYGSADRDGAARKARPSLSCICFWTAATRRRTAPNNSCSISTRS